MLYLNNKTLSIEGLIDLFKKNVIEKTEPSSPIPSLLSQLRKKLQKNYFPNKRPEEITKELIESDKRFDTYPKLKQALTFIFSSDDKQNIQTQLECIPLPKLMPRDAAPQWERLNRKFRYFEGQDLLTLFTQVARACRSISVLVEENLTDENMPYIYAYRLLVLFATQKPIPSFDEIAKKTYYLLNQANKKQKEKPFHDVIFNLIQLPKATDVQDLNGWLKFIKGETGIAFLHYFAIAPGIEAELHKRTREFKAPKDLPRAEAMATLYLYPRFAENPKLAKLCRAYNIPADGDECTFNKCVDYLNSLSTWPMKTTDNLPNPVIIGVQDAKGYCWVKLPTDDLRALILGVITACCQSIGGDSERCVKDAVTLPNNGLYVLLKRKDKAAIGSHPYDDSGKINDADFEIVGQSYAWISSTGNLTLDSLECSKGRVTTLVAKALLTQFAKQVLIDNPSIKRVTLGINGGTPEDLGLTIAAIPEKMRSGFLYGDSLKQYMLNMRSTISEEQFNVIMLKLGIVGFLREALNYLSEYLSDTSHFEEELTKLLKESPEFISQLNRETLFRLLSLSSTPTLHDLRPIDFDRLDKLSAENKKIELTQISFARFVWRDMTPEEGLKALHYIPAELRLNVFQIHKQILFQALTRPELLIALLKFYPQDERQAEIIEQKYVGKSLLQCAANYPESLQILLEHLKEDTCLDQIHKKNKDGNTILHLAASSIKSLSPLLKKIPESQLLATIKKENKKGHTVVYNALNSKESLTILLGMLTLPDQIALIKGKNRMGKTILDSALYYPDSFALLLNFLPEDVRLDEIKKQDSNGLSILSYATNHPKSFQILLDMLPHSDRLEEIQIKSRGRKTLLHLAAKNPESLEIILRIILTYPHDVSLAIIQEKDEQGKTVLYHATKNPGSLKILLSLCPKDAFIDAIIEKNSEKQSLLHMTTDVPESLIQLLEIYPEEVRLAAIKEKDKFGDTVLHLAANNPASLKELLAIYSEGNLLESIKEVDNDGYNVLHLAASHPESLKLLLANYTEDNCFEAIQEKNSNNETVLHLAARNPSALQLLLDIYPKDIRLIETIKEKTSDNETVLDIAASNPATLEVILNALPRQSLKELSPEILKRPEVKQLIAERTKRPSQADLGLFKPKDETPGETDKPKLD